MPRNPHASNSWKRHATGEDKDTLRIKDWIRDLCRRRGYNCETERFFQVNFHDTNELAENKEIPFPVDIYISHRKKPYQAIVEIDGGYHDEIKQVEKDRQRDEAIQQRYNIPIFRFKKRLLLGGITEQELVEKLGL